ncbi:MAG TPA: hypothetical protein VIK89_03400, partial [Cytophagaceae bacterium]
SRPAKKATQPTRPVEPLFERVEEPTITTEVESTPEPETTSEENKKEESGDSEDSEEEPFGGSGYTDAHSAQATVRPSGAPEDDDSKLRLKRELLAKCIALQTDVVNTAKKAMDEAQEGANEEQGSTEEKFDGFRESLQITRDMYAKQLHEGLNNLGLLNRIFINLHEEVMLGSVIFTEHQNYFISVSLGEIKIDDVSFVSVSNQSPIYKALAGKRKGEKFYFRDSEFTILECF